MTSERGRKSWIIADGYIPPYSHTTGRELLSHEAFCILNTSDKDAHVNVTIFFADREPVGPFRLTVHARRTLHTRFNDLSDPERIPLGVDYSALIESDVKIVVQQTRLDSRQTENALMTTIAYPCD